MRKTHYFYLGTWDWLIDTDLKVSSLGMKTGRTALQINAVPPAARVAKFLLGGLQPLSVAQTTRMIAIFLYIG